MSRQRTDPHKIEVAQQLRVNQTEAEARLWHELRAHQVNGVHFRRQHPIDHYIVDFCAPSKKLVIEVDGASHNGQQDYDLERTHFLEAKGYRVIRFWNHEILRHTEDVIRAIREALTPE